jgi:hypothetical protein
MEECSSSPNCPNSLQISLFFFLLSLLITLYITLTLLYFPFLCNLLQGPSPGPLHTLSTTPISTGMGKTMAPPCVRL